MTDFCKSGLWDIDPQRTCPVCGALPDTDCLAATAATVNTTAYDAKLTELMVELALRCGGSWHARWATATWLMDTYHSDIPHEEASLALEEQH